MPKILEFVLEVCWKLFEFVPAVSVPSSPSFHLVEFFNHADQSCEEHGVPSRGHSFIEPRSGPGGRDSCAERDSPADDESHRGRHGEGYGPGDRRAGARVDRRVHPGQQDGCAGGVLPAGEGVRGLELGAAPLAGAGDCDLPCMEWNPPSSRP